MSAGRFEAPPGDQQRPGQPYRLVPQPDGYADYVTQPRGHGQHRHQRSRAQAKPAKRQRSIRSTITILLVIPLISLVALWAYAAASTVGGALAKQNADTLNTDLGAPIEALNQQLALEQADTFAWQSTGGLMPNTSMITQRRHTDAALAVFRAAQRQAAGLEPAADKPVSATLLSKLSALTAVRARVDSGQIAPITAFGDYTAAIDAILPFSDALANPDDSIALYAESQAAIQEGEAVDDIGQEAALVGGALAARGVMSADVHRLFVQTVDDQRLLEQEGDSPLDWQQSANPYPALFDSPVFAAFRGLENKIVDARPGRLPVSPVAWQQDVGAVLAKIIQAETAERLGITAGETHAGDVILLRLVIVGGAGLLAVVISFLLLLGFGNRISRELTGLRAAARELANERLPSVVGRLRAGDDMDVEAEAPPLALNTKTREVTETAEAFSAVQHTAVEAAVEQARLRKAVSLVFRSLSRRNQSLLQRQLKMLDEMERGTEDPEALEQLFRLDHLTTRMRRQAEGLIILSGAAPGRGWRQPVPVVEVLRGAIGEIEDYARVDLITDSPDFLQGAGVADVTHLLAELVENAVQFSPPTTRVAVRCGRVANGYVIEIEDRGLGVPDQLMGQLNERLARPPEFDLADSDQLGLFVVSRLADRHQIKVTLRGSSYGGTLAIVLLPHDLVVSEEETIFLAAQGAMASPQGAMASPQGAMASTATAARRQVPGRALDPAVTQQVHGYPERDVAFASGAGLPRRQPMTSMAPQLRESRSGAGSAPAPGGRSPEQARALFSSIQRGWQQGMSSSGMNESTPAAGDDSQAT